MEFSRQDYCSEKLLLSPGDLPYSGIKPGSPALQVDSLPSKPPGRPIYLLQFSSVQSLSRVQLFATPWTAARQDSLSITNPGVHPNSCPLSWWCHPTISSSVIPFFFCLQSFPASGSFQMSQLFASGGQSIQHQAFQRTPRTYLL